MIEFKPGAEPKKISIQIVEKLPHICRTFEFFEYPCIISCSTGDHGPDDPHTHGYAEDFRTNHIPDLGIIKEITEYIEDFAGEDYFVQFEPDEFDENGKQTKWQHIHFQVRKDLWPKLMKG